METITAQRRVAIAPKHRHGRKSNLCLKNSNKVRIWREDQKRHVGPYTEHCFDNEETVYLMTDKIKTFSPRMVPHVFEDELDDKRALKHQM